MNWEIVKPCSKLSPFVRYYWMMDSAACADASEKIRLIPSGCIELRFNFGAKYLNYRSAEQPELEPQIYLSGQNSSYYDISPTGEVGVFSVMFTPIGAAMFFRMPMSEINNQIVSLDEITNSEMERIEEKLYTSTSNKQRVKIIEEFLLNSIETNIKRDYKRIAHSVSIINNQIESPSIRHLASEACWSEKQFNRKFKEFVGCNPKQFLRVVRFQRVLFMREYNLSNSLTELSHACGYYDQAHFTNEFKAFTGFAPKEYFRTNEAHSDYFQI
jgi:AraC-like DNA-binding protein